MRAARIALAMPPSRVRTVALPALDALAIAPVLTDDTTRSALRSRPAGGYVWEARGIEQAIDLGKEPRKCAARPQHCEHSRRMPLRESARYFLPDPFGCDRLELTRRDDLAHQLLRLARNFEPETRGEAGDAQHAEGIFD